MDSTLDKIKHISYNANNGEVMYEEGTLIFNVGDKNTAFLHLRGNLPNYIRAELKIKAPNGEIVLLTSKIINNLKNICRQFEVIVNESGTYDCQLVLSYSNKTNVSNKFSYKVNQGI